MIDKHKRNELLKTRFYSIILFISEQKIRRDLVIDIHMTNE